MSEGAPGPAEILSHWNLDVAWIALLLAAGGLYVWAFGRSRRAGRPGHPGWRGAAVLARPRGGGRPARAGGRAGAFLPGVAVVAAGVLSPLEHYGDQVVWVDFLGFLVLTMIS